MAYIKKTRLEKIKQLDLLTYLKNFEPDRLKRLSHNTYCIKDHDSLHISNGLWNWLSQPGVGGRSALDFLIKVDGYKFLDAAHYIDDRLKGIDVELPIRTYEQKAKHLEVPIRASNDNKAIDYLSSRGISKTIIHYCIEHYLIYQHDNDDYSNVCFVGYNRKINLPRQITMRGIGTTFVGEVSGSNKSYSFCIEPDNKESDTVRVFEGAIDALSQATLFEMDGLEFNKDYLLSVNGITIPRDGQDIKLPIALEQFLIDHPFVNKVILQFDLDKVGRKASHLVCNKLNYSPNYTCIEESPKYYKDINDSLCIELGLKPIPTRTKSNILSRD